MRKMLFAGDAPWSCVRDGIEYFQTTTLAGADSATKKAIKEVFGAKGSKVDVDLMTVPHHGSTNNMDVDGNYPVNATNIIVCSGDGGIKYSTTMADGTAVTELLEQFSTATAYCTMAKFQAGESSWALKVEYYPSLDLLLFFPSSYSPLGTVRQRHAMDAPGNNLGYNASVLRNTSEGRVTQILS
jgi:hypothetical protein